MNYLRNRGSVGLAPTQSVRVSVDCASGSSTTPYLICGFTRYLLHRFVFIFSGGGPQTIPLKNLTLPIITIKRKSIDSFSPSISPRTF